jgi:hypothetical protein
MNTYLQIPKTYTIMKRINNFKIGEIQIELNVKATIQLLLFDNDTLIDVKTIILEGDDYQDWGLSDQYILEYCENWIYENF